MDLKVKSIGLGICHVGSEHAVRVDLCFAIRPEPLQSVLLKSLTMQAAVGQQLIRSLGIPRFARYLGAANVRLKKWPIF